YLKASTGISGLLVIYVANNTHTKVTLTAYSHYYNPLFVFVPCAGAGGWSPLVSDRYQWLEVDLGRRTQITAVATQGRYGSSDWLTAYLLMFSDTGHNWRQHRQEDSLGAFPGNSNADTVVQYKLEQPVIARFLRLIPLDWNPSGRIGLRLEIYGCRYTSSVASFDGSRSSLVYRLSVRASWTVMETISLKFKTLKNSGTLLHAEGQRDHSLTLVLEKGKLLLYHLQGVSSSSGGQLLVSLGSLLDDQHWHHVKLERLSTHLNLTVDKNTLQSMNIHVLSLSQSFLSLSLPSSCSQGNVTFSCAEPVSVAVTFTDSHSFLQLPGLTSWSTGLVSVTLQFRTWNKGGLLLTFGLPQQDGTVFLYLSQARLRLQISKAGRSSLDLSAGSGLNDGQWHYVELKNLSLNFCIDIMWNHLDNLKVQPLDVFPFSGCPTGESAQKCKNPFNTFQGCMRLLTLDDQTVDLIKVQQRLLGNYSHLQIDMCGIIDRCSPSHCEHGGICTQSWSTFHCNCSNSGYRGATCHSSIYEQSCEAYKHKGNMSGHYYIDVDGSGPIKPQLIYCNMTEDKTWMVIQHNNTELTRVQSSAERNQHFAYFDYSSEEEQLVAVISQSEHCEQELSYHCRKSRLSNTLGNIWRNSCYQTSWGGALTGTQQCGCSLQDSCLDPSHDCNCDADYDQWTEDSGLLTHKETLPVRSLVLGDIHRPGSEAAYRVGPLRCHGDKNFWNAAFFDKETSYLHFPTFQGELNADISFLFKTTSSSGVFLENLGIKDFIRIELSSSMEVVFSFDVGNGPLDVRVKTSFPLNDSRWHRVQAERNVKEASLRVDNFPAATHEAPTDGLMHLQLNSQLFIGTASRQKGFLGCIRSLQLNGVTLDLEKRAKITPGVLPGCPGHCSSYGSLCQNEGRCEEKANGFSCDCGQSAYSGAFCHKEVSATFKSTTSITYILKEPFELSRNSSGLPSSIYSDITLRGESISLSFSTNQSPALLLYVSSFYREYLILLINKNGEDSQIAFSLGCLLLINDCVFLILQPIFSSMVVHCRQSRGFIYLPPFPSPCCVFLPLDSEPDGLDAEMAELALLGFTGCLSGVHFNSISPLKAALLHPDSPVIVTGPLVQSSCGSSSPANTYAAETTHSFSGTGSKVSLCMLRVIAVVIFVTLSALAVMARFICSRKETYRNQEVKAAQPEDSNEFPFSGQPDSPSAPSENQKEYFI
uniref:Contactin-associated protein-like 4 n=1 Tax=Pundamilia nyererei TaxID=303518 RepID=A0A3B4GFW4_9CICH